MLWVKVREVPFTFSFLYRRTVGREGEGIREMKANESFMGLVNKKELLERVLDRDERKEKA